METEEADENTDKKVRAAVEESEQEVLNGVTLVWSSSFYFEELDVEDEFEFELEIENTSNTSVEISEIELRHTTPRPRMQAPEATVEVENGLPVAIEPGDEVIFTVSVEYVLVTTDEGNKANLHFFISGHVNEAEEPFHLGVNVHLRGSDNVHLRGSDNVHLRGSDVVVIEDGLQH